MDRREELRHYIKAVVHISEEELIGYYEGRLEATDREKVQSHLAQCAECQTAFKAISEFLEPTGGEADSPEDVEVRQAWRAFWPRVAADPVRRTPPVPPEPVAIRPGWRSPFLALAASLTIAILAGGWWWSWQRSRVLQRYWQAQANAALQSLASLKTENQQLRVEKNQTQETLAKLSERLQALASPKLNAAVALVHSLGPTRRPEDRIAPALVPVPPGAPFLTLILYPAGKAAHPSYRVELSNARQAVVWSASGLRLDTTLDAYTLNLPTELVGPAKGMPPSDYTLAVYGERPGRRIPVDHYYLRFIPKS